MKMKRLISTITLLSAILFAGSAAAATYAFNDLIDDWTIGGAVPIVEGFGISYQHNILDDGFSLGDTVISATLELDFTNDLTDSFSVFGFTIDLSEFVDGNADGQFFNLGEVDNGQHTVSINTALLIDGILDVHIDSTNLSILPSIAWLDHSRLFGTAETAPPASVSEPGSLILVGLGLVFFGLVSHRRELGRREYC